jgi:hypothetical protein
MRAIAISRAEQNVDRAASAIFAGACAYAAYVGLGLTYRMPLLGAAAGAAAVAGYLVTVRILGVVEPEARKAPLSVFDLRTFDPSEPDEMLLLEGPEAGELVLTEKERLPDNPFERAERLLLEHYKSAAEPKPAAGDEEEPLLLDDILAELGPDSRVVRLFDRDAMPTPAELKSRIDRHLGPDGGIPDAGQALNEALDELRRSIR